MFKKNPNLAYHDTLPKTVSRTALVKSPDAFLGGGSAQLLCSLGEAEMLIDFHEEVVGGLEVKIRLEADAHVEIIYEEEPDGAMRREPYNCGWYKQVKDVYDAAAGEHTLVSRGRRGFRYVGLFVKSEKNAELLSAKGICGGWPVEERGSFRCSEERLNKIWDISRNTARACMQDFYEDGVKRDGLLWVGDFRLTFRAEWCAFGEADLARRSLLMIRDSQYETGAIPACCADGGGQQHDREDGISYMPSIPGGLRGWIIPNYLADYICGIDEYILRTGDESILGEVLDSAERTARFMLTLSDLDTPGQWWIDEFENQKDETGQRYTIHHDCKNMPKLNIGSKGGVLMEMLMALRALGRLAERAGNQALRTWSDEQAARLDSHIEAHYREGVYGQYTDLAGQKAPDVSQHVTMRAILADKQDENGVKRMARMLLPNISFAIAWRIEALMKAGRAQDALRDIRAAWGKMLDMDSLTCWERLDVPEMNETHYYDAPGSYCHGWGASPAWQLPEWILGVQPVKDGYEEIAVQPNLIDMDWAEANIPTPEGEIFARAERCGGGMKLTLDLPECVKKCRVILPDGREEELKGPGDYIVSMI